MCAHVCKCVKVCVCMCKCVFVCLCKCRCGCVCGCVGVSQCSECVRAWLLSGGQPSANSGVYTLVCHVQQSLGRQVALATSSLEHQHKKTLHGANLSAMRSCHQTGSSVYRESKVVGPACFTVGSHTIHQALVDANTSSHASKYDLRVHVCSRACACVHMFACVCAYDWKY